MNQRWEETARRIAKAHVRTIDHLDRDLLLARAAFGAEGVGTASRLSARRARERLRVLQEVVAAAAEASAEIGVLTFWAGQHLTCCLGLAAETAAVSS